MAGKQSRRLIALAAAVSSSVAIFGVNHFARGTPLPFTWTSTTSGSWSDSTSWTTIPGAPVAGGSASYIINYAPSGNAAVTSTLDAVSAPSGGYTLNSLVFQTRNWNNNTILAGTNSLNFAVDVADGGIDPSIQWNTFAGYNSGGKPVIQTPITVDGAGGSGNMYFGPAAGTGNFAPVTLAGSITASNITSFNIGRAGASAYLILTGAGSNNTLGGAKFNIAAGSVLGTGSIDQTFINSISSNSGGAILLSAGGSFGATLDLTNAGAAVRIGAVGNNTLSSVLIAGKLAGSNDSVYEFGGNSGPPQDVTLTNYQLFGVRGGVSSTLTVNSFLTDPASGRAGVIISSDTISSGFVVLNNATNNFTGALQVAGGGNLLVNSAVNGWGANSAATIWGGIITIGGAQASLGSNSILVRDSANIMRYGLTGNDGHSLIVPGVIEIDNTADFASNTTATALANATLNFESGTLAQDNNTSATNIIGTVNVYGNASILMHSKPGSAATNGILINSLNRYGAGTIEVVAGNTSTGSSATNDLGTTSQLFVAGGNAITAPASGAVQMIDPHIMSYQNGNFVTYSQASGLTAVKYDVVDPTDWSAVTGTNIVNVTGGQPLNTKGINGTNFLNVNASVAALRVGYPAGYNNGQSSVGGDGTGNNDNSRSSIHLATSGAGTTINILGTGNGAAGLALYTAGNQYSGYMGHITIDPNLNFGTNEAVIYATDNGNENGDVVGAKSSAFALGAFTGNVVINGQVNASSITKSGGSSVILNRISSNVTTFNINQGALTLQGGVGGHITVAAGAAVQTYGAPLPFIGGDGTIYPGGNGPGNWGGTIGTPNAVISPGMGFSNGASIDVGVLTAQGFRIGGNTKLQFDLGAPNVSLSAPTSDEFVSTVDLGIGGVLVINPLPGFGPGKYQIFNSTALDFGVSNLTASNVAGSTSPLLSLANGAYLPKTYNGFSLTYSVATTTTELDLIVSGTPIVVNTNTVTTEWSAPAGGTWGVLGDWTAGVPTALGDTATFGTNLTSSSIVTLDSSRTVSTLNFKNALASYTIAGGGSVTLTVDGGADVGAIYVLAGSHAITAPLNLGSNGVNIGFANSASLTVGSVGGTSPVIGVGGPGTLTIAATGSLPTGASLGIAAPSTVQLNATNGVSLSSVNNSGTLGIGNNVSLAVTSSFTSGVGSTIVPTGNATLLNQTGANLALQGVSGTNAGTLTVQDGAAGAGISLNGAVTYAGQLRLTHTPGHDSSVTLNATTAIPNIFIDPSDSNYRAAINIANAAQFNASSVVEIKSGSVNVPASLRIGTLQVDSGNMYFPANNRNITLDHFIVVGGEATINNGGGAIIGSGLPGSYALFDASFGFQSLHYLSGNWANGVTVSGSATTLYINNASPNDFTGGLTITGGSVHMGAGGLTGAQVITVGTAPGDAATLNTVAGTNTYNTAIGQTYQGFGTINTGTFQLNAGGTMSPGSSTTGVLSVAGNLSVKAGSTLGFTLGSGVSDSQIAVSGLLSLDSTGSVNLSLSNAVIGNSYQVMTYGSYTGPLGDISSEFTLLGLASNEKAVISETGTNAGQIVVQILATQVNSQWAAASSGSWGAPGNWTAGIPLVAGDVANFGTNLSSSGSVTLNNSRTIGALVFNNNLASYTIAGNGTAALALDIGGAGAATINVTAGSHTIALPLSVSSNGVDVSFAGASNLTVNTVTGAGPIAVSGSGTLTVAPNGSLPANTSLSIASNSTVALATNSGAGIGAAHLSTFNSLTVNGTLDVGNNALMINYSGTNTPLVQVANLVSSARGTNGLWQGTGITSAFAAATAQATTDTTHIGIGYNEASTVAGFQGSNNTTFLGASITTNSTALLVVPTLYGDITLQGTVNLDDLNIFATNFGKPTNKGWAVGDFLNEGSVTLDDLNLFAANFGKSLTGFPALTPAEFAQGEAILALIGTSPVPEPASLSLLALGAGGLWARRRRSPKAPATT